jgi:beta-lactam-binding protein with PASTA domain/tRNA A-37 threonylcarbamoyl transferase component Bud32
MVDGASTIHEYGGRYQLRRSIASGGMAEVYLARDALLDRPVALKLMHPEFARDRSFIDRFRREAQAAASLNDPRIVSIYDWGSDEGTYFIVMEYVDGKTLREIIRAEGRIPARRAVEIASEVLAGLQLAHAKGIIHRDIKPANIAVTEGGQTKVMDFGIARAASDSGQTMTQTGMVIGTAGYFSPEQAQGLPVDPRSDIYSVGVILYEMLTGQLPFTGDTAVSIAYKHVTEDPVPPRVVNPDIPEGLEAVVMKALAKNPENRYQSADQMRGDLLRLLKGEKVEATPLMPADQTSIFEAAEPTAVISRGRERSWEQPPPRGGGTGKIIATVVALVVLALLGAYYVLTNGVGAPNIEVPNVVGKTLQDAQILITQRGLHSNVAKQEFSPVVASGSVISQNPESGILASKDSTVSLVVSAGKEQLGVPNLIGKTRGEAEALLTSSGLELGSVFRRSDDNVEAGKVLDQDPKTGVSLDRGSSVDITISGGKKMVEVPDVVGANIDDATTQLTDAGLTPKITETCDKSEKPDRVLAQNPPPPTQVADKSTVTLTVNRSTDVPSVLGQDPDSASAALDSAGFKAQVIQGQLNVFNKVTDQDPNPGKSACKGDTVVITVH